jgi:F0F1-type ATP synthase membrane subunit c/vacuolar-type H+-ATPase subunit K
VSKLTRLLRAKSAAPGGLRYAAYLATMIVVWAALAVAHVGFGPTIVFGFAAGLVAELAVEAWWRRRERQRDLKNGFVASRREDLS